MIAGLTALLLLALAARSVDDAAGSCAVVTADLQIVFVFGVFLGLLAAGMAGALRHRRAGDRSICCSMAAFRRCKGLGPDELGQHEQLHADLDPDVHPDGRDPAAERLSQRFYRGLTVLVRGLPGGLLQTNIAGCALFAAISGSSVATAAAIGTVALPQLEKRNYDRPMAAGSLAAGGTLGILIPPSIAMIIYGTFTETSIAKLFMAGVVPGLVLTALFMAYVFVHRACCGPRSRRARAGRRISPSSRAPWPTCCPFVLLIGGSGQHLFRLATPTEAAAVGCLVAFIVSAIWGRLGWAELRRR